MSKKIPKSKSTNGDFIWGLICGDQFVVNDNLPHTDCEEYYQITSKIASKCSPRCNLSNYIVLRPFLREKVGGPICGLMRPRPFKRLLVILIITSGKQLVSLLR